jgi:hypothetical protein
MLVMASSFLYLSGGQAALAQAQPELRNVTNQFRTEAGCPVQVVSAKTELEIDPLGAPMACRIYIDYKNVSAKTVNGAKFRIGYIDGQEQIRGSFHAPDGHIIEPGGVVHQKWRGDKVDPRTAYVLIRCLAARYSDGSMWESEKMKDLAPGTGGDGSAYAPGKAGAAGSGSDNISGAGGAGSGTPPSAGSSSQAGNGLGTATGTPSGTASPPAGSAGSGNSSDGY